jgi:hypothetical protein
LTEEQIGQLTPDQLAHRLRGDSPDPRIAEAQRERIRERRAAAFRKVCDCYGMRPWELSRVAAPDLAAYLRAANDLAQVDVGSLPAHVAEFIEDAGWTADEREAVAHPR